MSDSGEIGREELPGIIGRLGHTPNPEMIQEAFEKCDKNKKGEIGFEELVKLMRAYRQTDGFSFVRGAFAPSGLSWCSCLACLTWCVGRPFPTQETVRSPRVGVRSSMRSIAVIWDQIDVYSRWRPFGVLRPKWLRFTFHIPTVFFFHRLITSFSLQM